MSRLARRSPAVVVLLAVLLAGCDAPALATGPHPAQSPALALASSAAATDQPCWEELNALTHAITTEPAWCALGSIMCETGQQITNARLVSWYACTQRNAT